MLLAPGVPAGAAPSGATEPLNPFSPWI